MFVELTSQTCQEIHHPIQHDPINPINIKPPCNTEEIDQQFHKLLYTCGINQIL